MGHNPSGRAPLDFSKAFSLYSSAHACDASAGSLEIFACETLKFYFINKTVLKDFMKYLISI